MTTSPRIHGGKEAWVGSGAPNRTHFDTSRLWVRDGINNTYLKRPCPVPDGDTVTVGELSLWFADTVAETVTFTCKRLAEKAGWSDLNWNNKPSVTGAAVTVTVVNPTKGDQLTFDVADQLQAIADGDPNYGWRITSDSATRIRFYGGDSIHPPELYAEYYDEPSTPTDLSPSGTISLAAPVVSASADDVTGEDEVARVRWQIDPASDPVAPGFDSDWVDATSLELDLSRTDLPGGIYPGLALDTTTYQRCQWETQAGVQSAWSDWYPMTRTAKPVITITNPPVGGTVTDVTPTLIATVDKPIVAYRVRVLSPNDKRKVRANSHKQPATGTTISWNPPDPLAEINHRVEFDLWDSEDRAGSPGDPRYTRVTRDFTITDGVASTPTVTSVAQVGASPVLEVAFTTAVTPDSFTFYDNGEPVAANVLPEDVLVSGTNYVWRWSGATPGVAHTFKVRAVETGDHSPKSNGVTITPRVVGIWVIDIKDDLAFVVGGKDVSNWRMVDQVGEYQIHGGGMIYVFAGSNGLAGSCSGTLRDRPDMGLTLADLEADLWAVKANKGREVRLVLGDMSIPVVLKNLTCGPHPDTSTEHGPRKMASFEFTSDYVPEG